MCDSAVWWPLVQVTWAASPPVHCLALCYISSYVPRQGKLKKSSRKTRFKRRNKLSGAVVSGTSGEGEGPSQLAGAIGWSMAKAEHTTHFATLTRT